MSGIKRFCLIVFGLAGVLCLAALVLPWVGPYQSVATRLMDNRYYRLALLATFAVTACGMLICLLRGLFTPRRRKTVVVHREGRDQISVTTAAISAQATHLVEDGGRFIAERVRVVARKRGGVSVDVRVKPRRTVNVAQQGVKLHDELARGLSVICGDRVARINLQFVEAVEAAEAQNVTVENIEVPEVTEIAPTTVVERTEPAPDEHQHPGIFVPLEKTTPADKRADGDTNESHSGSDQPDNDADQPDADASQPDTAASQPNDSPDAAAPSSDADDTEVAPSDASDETAAEAADGTDADEAATTSDVTSAADESEVV